MEAAAYYNALAIALRSDYNKLAELNEFYSSWKEAWQAISGKQGTGIEPTQGWRRLNDAGVRLLLREDDAFPKFLREIPLAPFGLYVRGSLPTKLCLAIVGTRKATSEGKILAQNMSAALAGKGITIVSGLALGIDAAAHDGCLKIGGQTIAVLANGLDRFYPATNEALGKKILDSGGAIISEYPLGAEPFPSRFLERNRLVSGLAQGTLIIEAPYASGALATARFALEQNREVFVIPGPVSHPNFKGSHKLIRSGAELVTSAEDIMEAFGLDTETAPAREEAGLSGEEQTVLAVLKSNQAASVDRIQELTNLGIPVINQTLSFLTVKNKIKETGDGYTLA